MGMFKNWKEYLDHRGTLVEKPKTDHSPTYTGPSPKSPAKEAKAKTNPKSYRPAKEEAPKKGEKGFADHKVPVNKPDKNQKTEAFLEKTRNMPLAEFANYMLKECGCGGAMAEDDTLPTVTSYATGKFHPYPPEAIRYVAALAKKNPRIMESLIQELKKQEAYGDLLSTGMDHPETYVMLTDLLGDDDEGPQRSRSLVRAMDDKYSKFIDDQSDMFDDEDLDEAVAPPYGVSDEDDDEDEKLSSPEGDDLGDEEEIGAGDEEDPAVGDLEADAPTDDDDLEPDEEGPRNDLGQDELTDDEPTDEELPDAPEEEEGTDPVDIPPRSAPKPVRKVKKKFAHDHLLDAMSNHEHMKERMKGYVR